MIGLAEVMLILLVVITVIDLYIRKIPAILLTSGIFLVAIISFYFNGSIQIVFGAFAFLFALMLYEGAFFKGIADIKVLIMIGMMMSSMGNFFIMMILTIFFGLFSKILLVYGFKLNQYESIPFIPILFIVYLAMYFLGGVI